MAACVWQGQRQVAKNKCAKSIKLCVTGDSPQTAGLEARKSDAQVIR